MYQPTPLSPMHTLNGGLSKPPNKKLPSPVLVSLCLYQGTGWVASRREHWKEGISTSYDFTETLTLNTHHGHFILHTQSGHMHQQTPLQMPLSAGSRLLYVMSNRMLLQCPISVYKIYRFNYRMQGLLIFSYHYSCVCK